MTICTAGDCGRTTRSRGLCPQHYQAWRRTTGIPGRPGCSVSICAHPRYARGLCHKHYCQLKASGLPLVRTTAEPIERLLSRIEIDLSTGCWRYTGTHTDRGYAQISVDGTQVGVHRFAHEFWIGPIPDGLHVDHVWSAGCRFKDCCLPEHLEAISASENNRRRSEAKAVAS